MEQRKAPTSDDGTVTKPQLTPSGGVVEGPPGQEEVRYEKPKRRNKRGEEYSSTPMSVTC